MIPGPFGQLVHETGDRVQERTGKPVHRRGKVTATGRAGRRRQYFVQWDDGSSGMYMATDIETER